MSLTEVSTYNRNEVAIFHRSANPLGCLQNMTGGMPILFQDRWYQSSEGAYQAQKFLKHHFIHQEIAEARSGFEAKLIAKKHKDSAEDSAAWEERRIRVMESVLIAKYEQHRFRINLEVDKFAGKPLVEFSRKDDFWGCKPFGEELLVGANVLGKLWMKVLEWTISRPRERPS